MNQRNELRLFRRIFRVQSYLGAILSLLLLSCGLPAQQRKSVLHPTELVENATNFLNRSVEVEILEPLYGPSSPENLAKAEYGQVEIRIPEGIGGRVSLVPEAFKVKDPNRYRHKFSQVIESPIRVRGEFLKDEELGNSMQRPVYVIRVSSMEPIILGAPEKVQSLNEIKNDLARWDRKQIIYEGTYRHGFEIAALDQMWLEISRSTAVIGKPSQPGSGSRSDRVRVTGTLFCRPNGHYGHLGGYQFMLLASKIEYLDSKPGNE
jgi:hypothetical protein